MSSRIPDVIIAPLRGPASSSVIFLHGLGDTSEGWATQIRHDLAQKLPSTRFVLPTAKRQPVTVNGGMPMPSWYDIVSLSRSRATEECAGLDESFSRVLDLIEAEKKSGVAPKNIALCGFSQGGALALWSALHYQGAEPLGGAFVLSGYLPRSHACSPSQKSTRIRLFHGDDDAVVLPDYAQDTLRRLKELGVTSASLKTYRDLGHESCEAEMTDFANELAKLFTPPPTLDDLHGMNAKSLKTFLAEAGVERSKINDCVEKHELLALAVEVLKQ